MSDVNRPKSTDVVVIASDIDQDDRLVEMIVTDGTSAFLTDASGNIATTDSVKIAGGRRAIPFGASNNLIAHRVVLFPSAATAFGSEATLVERIRTFIHKFADVSETFEEIATYYVLFSWVYDAFAEVPYLRLKGDFGSGKSRCLQAIGSLCYKPMFASGASTVSPIFRIIDSFRGTLVIDEGDFRFSDERAELIKILNNGNTAGFPVLRSDATPSKEFNPRAFNVFGPKIIATRRMFEDRALESRCITETMTGLPPRSSIPLSLPPSFHDEALALRNMLLMYRFQTLRDPRPTDRATLPDIEPRISQVYGPLLAVIADTDAQGRVIQAAKDASRAIRAERGTSMEAELVDVLYELRQEQTELSVKNITERFSDRFGDDYRRPVTTRWIGGQLRSRLSLLAVKTRGVYVLPPTEDRRLKTLFDRYRPGDMATVGIAERNHGSETVQ